MIYRVQTIHECRFCRPNVQAVLFVQAASPTEAILEASFTHPTPAWRWHTHGDLTVVDLPTPTVDDHHHREFFEAILWELSW